MDKKNKFYFTFGSDPGFPYQNTYLIVMAYTEKEAIQKFREKYPDRHKNTFNCAFVYTEQQWEGSLNQKYYPKEPAEIIGQESDLAEESEMEL